MRWDCVFIEPSGLCCDGKSCDDCLPSSWSPSYSQAEHSQPEKGVSGNATEREE